MSGHSPGEKPTTGEERFYRTWATGHGLASFEVRVAETDLQVFAERPLAAETEAAVRRVRRDIELYAAAHDGFLESFGPLDPLPAAPEVVERMCEAARLYSVGPMAAVAGAVAEWVGRELLHRSRQVIVENGGDIFFATDEPPVFGLFAGRRSPFTGRVRFTPKETRAGGVCTSSGAVGHSVSLGRADAVTVVARDTVLADAAATAIANTIRFAADVERAIEVEKERGLLEGGIVAIGDTLGAWGALELIEDE